MGKRFLHFCISVRNVCPFLGEDIHRITILSIFMESVLWCTLEIAPAFAISKKKQIHSTLMCCVTGDYSRARTLNWGGCLLHTLFALGWMTLDTVNTLPFLLQELRLSSFWPVVETAIQVDSTIFLISSSSKASQKVSQAGIERANERAISNVAKIKRWTLLTRFNLSHHNQNGKILRKSAQ